MRKFVPLLLVLLLFVACNTAGPHFRGLPPTTVTVDGSTFDVRVKGKLAEAIRTMAMVSGCEVKEVRGDQSQVEVCKGYKGNRNSSICRIGMCAYPWNRTYATRRYFY
jgi:hypothetical protein